MPLTPNNKGDDKFAVESYHAYSMCEPSNDANGCQEPIPLSPMGTPRSRLEMNENILPDTISMTEIVRRREARQKEQELPETSGDHLEMIVPQPVRFSKSECL